VLPLIVVTEATDEVALVFVGKGRVAGLEVASHSVPECAGAAIEEVERFFKVATGGAVRSGSFVKQPVVRHMDEQ
jgi:hypothetical protein